MWNDLEMEIEICSKCILERVRKNPVTGKGNKKAKILFVMDSISMEEDNRNELLARCYGSVRGLPRKALQP